MGMGRKGLSAPSSNNRMEFKEVERKREKVGDGGGGVGRGGEVEGDGGRGGSRHTHEASPAGGSRFLYCLFRSLAGRGQEERGCGDLLPHS